MANACPILRSISAFVAFNNRVSSPTSLDELPHPHNHLDIARIAIRRRKWSVHDVDRFSAPQARCAGRRMVMLQIGSRKCSSRHVGRKDPSQFCEMGAHCFQRVLGSQTQDGVHLRLGDLHANGTGSCTVALVVPAKPAIGRDVGVRDVGVDITGCHGRRT